jgi:16S rRNA (cytidine1402-2'-O)-methyltransferase
MSKKYDGGGFEGEKAPKKHTAGIRAASSPVERSRKDPLKEKGILYVVPTPIGNLDDITIRGLQILKIVNIIACEDTRKSRILLSRWEIKTPLMSLHRFSEASKIKTILDRLDQGENVALISDAGTPAVSDPGDRLVRAVLDAGLSVTPLPGPCSIVTALSASGMEASSFVYLGFVPRKDEQRRAFFEELQRETRSAVFFETPRRIQATLKIAAEILGSRRMTLFRELTKLHEEILPGTAATLLEALDARAVVKGEIVVVVEGADDTGPVVDPEEAVRCLLDEGFSGKRLAEEAHRRFRVKKSLAYRLSLQALRPETS